MLRFSFFVICLIFQAEMFIGLLLRAMKNDVNLKRVAAFAKRMLQVSNKTHFSVIVLIWGRVSSDNCIISVECLWILLGIPLI